MSSTTNRAAAVTSIAHIAALITDQLLQPRRCFLKHRRPKSTYVHQLRRDIACGKAHPVEMLLAISNADLEEHVPIELVLQAYYSAIAELTERAQQINGNRARGDAPLLPLIQRETRLEAEFNAAENELLAKPDDVAVIDRVLTVSAEYDDAQDKLAASLREKRARLTSTGHALVAL